MGHKRQTGYQRFYIRPNFRKHARFLCIVTGESVHPGTPIVIIVWLRLNKRIVRIRYLTIPDYNHTYRAHARALIIGCLEIYRRKVSHIYPRI